MNEIIELLSSLGLGPLVAMGSAAAILTFFVIKKKKGGGKKSSSGSSGYEYGDSTTSGYDTKAGNFVDELNSDSVLTQDVQDFAVPNFDKDEFDRATASRGYKKKTFNSSLPGMTLGDTRPMIPQIEDDVEASLELRSEIKATAGFGLRPKVTAVDIATLTGSGLKILSDEDQLMRPASPEKVSANSSVQSINVPAHMKIANVDNGENLDPIGFYKKDELELNFDLPEMPAFEVEGEKEIIHEFNGLPEIKIQEDVLEITVDGLGVRKDESSLNFNKVSPSDGLTFFSMDNSINKSEESLNIDISDIPGLDLAAVDSIASENVKIVMSLEEPKETLDLFTSSPGLSLVEDKKETTESNDNPLDEYFMTINTRLDESKYPETVAYHQEINAALFLDDEDMKEQALQTLQNTVELIKNVKVKFYFKLAIQSYVNSTKDKALPDIMKNFYDFEFEKYSK